MKLKSQISTINHVLPVVAIVGPTASGKTSLAIDIAKKFNGEIICADSRSVYKGANIGTAKPMSIEKKGIPHWGLDLIEPDEYFSVSDFKKYADKKIIEIRSRGHIPFLVGGTGLYIDAVLFDYKFGCQVDSKLRTKLQRMTLCDLYDYCAIHEVTLPENYKNKRYVIRSIERNGIDIKKNDAPINNSIIVGIATEKSILKTRIEKRTKCFFNDGIVDEARQLGEKYGWENEAMKSNIYPLINKYLNGGMSLDDVKEKTITLDWRLAKRQLTWLRRNRFVHWLSLDDARKYLIRELAIRK